MHDDRRARRWSRIAAYALALTYAILVWFEVRPESIQGWRLADTQAIALHFTEPGASIFFPRIDWGGAGPGYVEAEFQLYTWLVSWGLRLFGDVAWVGQALSLGAMLGAVCVVFESLLATYGAVPALFGVLTLLCSRGVVGTAASVQPEALCFLLYVGAWFELLRYESTAKRRALWTYAALGAAAMLVKPSAAQLGISSFLLIALRSRALLKRRELWLAWLLMVGLLGAHLLWARHLYLEFGNTFGVLSGGDSKVPRVSDLFHGSLLWQAARRAVLWGTSFMGALAVVAALLFASQRERAAVIALLTGNVVWVALAFRYTSQDMGNHYHLPGALLGAQATAICVGLVLQKRRHVWALALAFACLLVALFKTLRFANAVRVSDWDASAVAAARAFNEHAAHGQLVIIRSPELARDARWQSANNFEDPRVFYLTKTRGWALALDDTDSDKLARFVRSGARFYVETIAPPESPALEKWLTTNATLLATTSFGGRVFALQASRGP
jgi:hypothetical protein